MTGGRTIAVTGKGGTGKTIVATLLINMLAERYPGKVLAIDADSAMSLPYTLGIPVSKTVSMLRKEIVSFEQIKREMNDKPLREVMRDILSKGEGFDLLTMGRPEEPGCFCAVNDLLRHGMTMLTTDYEVTVIDGEAGPEQINRRVLKSIDTLLVVADMSARSLQTARGIVEVAQKNEDGINVKKSGLILNRVRNDEPLEDLVKKVGLPVIGYIPEDPELNRYDRAGLPLKDLPQDCPSVTAVREILKRLMADDQ